MTGFGSSVSSSDINREIMKMTSTPKLGILKRNLITRFLKAVYTKQSQLQDGTAGRNTKKPRVTPVLCLPVNKRLIKWLFTCWFCFDVKAWDDTPTGQ